MTDHARDIIRDCETIGWRRIAHDQGQNRMSSETLDEFRARVMRLHSKRKTKVQVWRK